MVNFARTIIDNVIIYYATFDCIDDDTSFMSSIGSIKYVISDGILYIMCFDVLGPYRNRGIGTMLLYYALEEGKMHRAKYAKLDCMSDMTDEHNIYIRNGFKFINKTDGPEMVYTYKYNRRKCLCI